MLTRLGDPRQSLVPTGKRIRFINITRYIRCARWSKPVSCLNYAKLFHGPVSSVSARVFHNAFLCFGGVICRFGYAFQCSSRQFKLFCFSCSNSSSNAASLSNSFLFCSLIVLSFALGFRGVLALRLVSAPNVSHDSGVKAPPVAQQRRRAIPQGPVDAVNRVTVVSFATVEMPAQHVPDRADGLDGVECGLVSSVFVRVVHRAFLWVGGFGFGLCSFFFQQPFRHIYLIARSHRPLENLNLGFRPPSRLQAKFV